ncbi:MAG TPA: hypothetical protein VF905_03245 [Nitrospirota bacterium]
MSLEERMEDVDNERVLITPRIALDKLADNLPVSARAYSQLAPVNHEAIKNAAAQQDGAEFVMTPIGGRVPIGSSAAGAMGDVRQIPAPPPWDNAVIDYNQFPIMIDEKPAAEHDGTKEMDFGRMPNYNDYKDSVAGQEKPVEQVLAVPAWDFLSQILNPAGEAFPPDLHNQVYSNLAYIRRGWCEKDERFIQLLPYITFWKRSGDRIQLFTYQRGKGVGEERLAMNCSVGVGGHINPIDFLSLQGRMTNIPTSSNFEFNAITSSMLCESFWSGILLNVFREGDEEVKITDTESGEVIGLSDFMMKAALAEKTNLEYWLHNRTTFFLDFKATEVERHHLAMSIAIELPQHYDVVTNEAELIDVGFRDLEELWLDNDAETLPTRLEHWSRSVVDSLYDTIQFLKDHATEDIMLTSKFVRESMRSTGNHPVTAAAVAKIDPTDRWKIGTLAGSFSEEYRFYSLNAFVRA